MNLNRELDSRCKFCEGKRGQHRLSCASLKPALNKEDSKKRWDDYFMSFIDLIAAKSKDKSTKVGSIIVGPKNEIRSTGYNSFPMGIYDDFEERQVRPYKYNFFSHAEENAIVQCARVGTSTDGCRIYVTGVPCTTCTRMIINSGIVEVIYKDHVFGDKKRWEEQSRISRQMLGEAGVRIRKYAGNNS